MPITEETELEVVAPEEAVDREKLARLACWHWEMRGSPEDSVQEDWSWAKGELRRQRLAAGYEPDEA
jgi:hypothetical protein